MVMMSMSPYDYLKRGFWIFPIRAGLKTPLTRHGFNDASNDIDQIAQWIEEFPDCNWAVASGKSGLIIVDIDLYKGAKESDLVAVLGGAFPPTLRASTPSGGVHIYFKASEPLPPSSLSFIPGVDIMSRTGYVLLPGSSTDRGAYAWQTAPEMEIADAPASLVSALEQKREGAQISPAPSPTGPIKELFLKSGDGRWVTLQKHAGSLRAMGWSEKSIYQALSAFASNQCEADVSIAPDKIRALARWVCQKPATNLKNPTRIKPPSTVTMRAPSGKIVKIPQEKVAEALARGAQKI